MATKDKLVNLEDLKSAYDNTNAKFAPTEASTTASMTHAAGSYFILGGALCQATADIASGGTIVTSGSGKNCADVSGGIAGNVSDLKSAIVHLEWETTEGTKNINTVICGRYYVNSSGVINASSDNYFGMKEMVPCDASTDYSISAHHVGTIQTCYIAEFDSSGDFIQRTTGYSITTGATTAFIYIDFYNGNGLTIYNDSDIQIEKGTIATGYVKGLSAVDQVARANPAEHSLNIADTLDISTTLANIVTDGNGYKVICTKDSASASFMRYEIIDSVSSDDVGRIFTFSAYLVSKTGTDTRINFLSNNSNRKAVVASSAGAYNVTYEITASDVGRTLYAGLYAAFTSPMKDQYSVWHNIQIVESAIVLPYMGKKTCIDSTARARILEIGTFNRMISEHNIALTEDTTYYIKTIKPCVHLLKCRAKYTGTQPTIVFSNSLYTSPAYNIGDSDYKMQSWRIPPDLKQTATTIAITVPSGSSLVIDFLYTEESAFNPANQLVKPEFCAHLGFTQMCPQNTKPGFEMAGMLGYPALITTPQITQDGEIVCIHDETINATAVDADGNAPSTEMAVIDMTYSQLLEWDFGRKKNAYWTGARIPKFEEFLQICAKYGMDPVISTHPNVTPSAWGSKCADIKALLIKYGLLDKFVVKAFDIRYINASYAVFGQDIAGYVGEHGDSYISIADLTGFVESNSIDLSKCKVISEKSINTITESYVGDVLAAGLECGCYTITSSHPASTIKQLISYGVTSFTDDTYCQNGMDW